MKLLIIQNRVYETIQENLNHLGKMLNSIGDEQFDFIVLPEMFSTPYEMNYFIKNKQTKHGPVIQFLKNISKKYHSYVIGGSIPESKNNQLYNTSFIFNRSGQIIEKYRKQHLFSVTYPDGTTFRESDTLTKGSKTISFDTEFGPMGVMICFDIRFPMLARKLQRMGSKIIFVPAAFNTFTGPLHWHTTFKARAIDNQVFVVGASPANDSFGSYDPYGHSLVVDPLGNIVNELDEQVGYMIVDIDLNDIDQARKTIPIVDNDEKEQLL